SGRRDGFPRPEAPGCRRPGLAGSRRPRSGTPFFPRAKARSRRPGSGGGPANRPVRARPTRVSGPLNELDFVAVGVLDEGDHRGAELHRPRFAGDLRAPRPQPLTGGDHILNPDREMAEGIARLVALDAVIVGELDHRLAVFIAVPDEGQGVFPVRHVAAAQLLHPEQPRVEIDASLEVANPDHGVEKAAHELISSALFDRMTQVIALRL